MAAWTKSEINRLITSVIAGHGPTDLAQIFGRPIGTVIAKIAYLRVRGSIPDGTVRRSRGGRCNPSWTFEDLDDLQRSFGAETIFEIAARQGRTPGSVAQRARSMGLDMAEERQRDEQTPGDIEIQDLKFQTALLTAIQTGAEHAPIGISKQPCTRHPIFVDRAHTVTQSSCTSAAALCAEG